MSDEIFYTTLTLIGLVFLAMCIYIVKGKLAQKRNPDGYRWEPEQDYDVVLQGETPMTPGFPVLKKRKNGQASRDSRSQGQ
ncbi:MAG: hypothetical protein ABJH63_11250 [Rhizobiaceae bacterium]